jgi:DNA-binding MarR family transcriptional regulator
LRHYSPAERGSPMQSQIASEGFIATAEFRRVVSSLVRSASPDLSMRQMSVFLAVYLDEDAKTVRGLAAELNVSKPAITRALDRLTDLGFVARKTDPADRRSILVEGTDAGVLYLKEIRRTIDNGSTSDVEVEQPVRAAA